MNIVLNMVTGEVETMPLKLEVTTRMAEESWLAEQAALQLVPVASCTADKWRAIEAGIFSRPSVFF